jgi:hypothetical protein
VTAYGRQDDEWDALVRKYSAGGLSWADVLLSVC